jgi:Flp pilus assembly protein CpaB
VFLAFLAAVLTVAYVNRSQRQSTLAGTNVAVFVAARDIPAGTPGSALLGRGALVEQRVPRRSVVPGAISDREQVATLIAADPIYSGEQISTRRFRPIAEHGVRGELNGTARAIIVAGEPTQLLSGIVRTGDRVDVLAAAPVDTREGTEPATRLILRDLLVLSAPGEEDPAAEGARRGNSVVLSLTDAQAQKLFFAMKHGQWSLILRPFGRAAETRTGIDTANTVLRGAP